MTNGSADRVGGELVGLAAGDALGAGYEFGPPLTEDPEMRSDIPFVTKP
jgi:ADP-ribosyl-[dinitrogen reductase] hydrolase